MALDPDIVCQCTLQKAAPLGKKMCPVQNNRGNQRTCKQRFYTFSCFGGKNDNTQNNQNCNQSTLHTFSPLSRKKGIQV